MLNLLQYLSSFVIFLFLVSLGQATSFGISPSYSIINLEEGGIKCLKYKIIGNSGSLLIDDLWSDMKRPKGIDDYNLKIYEIETISTENRISNEVEVCFIAKKEGNYEGLILFDKIDSNLALGSKVKLIVSSNSINSRITGFSVIENKSNLLVGFVIFEVILIFSVLILIIYKRRHFFDDKT